MKKLNTIYVNNSYYLITDVYEIPKRIRYYLSKWVPTYFKYNDIGFYYDNEKHELRIPRGYRLENICDTFPNNKIIYNDDFTDYEKINIGLLNFPRDYMQDNVLAYMTGHSPFESMGDEHQLYIDLTTGYGKTYLMVATACFYKARCLVIIPPISKIGNQWIDTVGQFTTLNRDEYLYVKGTEMCKDIIKGKYKKIKFFVMPRSTVLAFVNSFDKDWSMFTKLVDAMNVSIKAIDEAHMDFNTIVNIDCFSNVQRTYYMSSSPSRSDDAEKNIYKLLFANVPKYGKKLITKELNHLVPVILEFKSRPSMEWEKKIHTRYGTSLAKYEDYLLAEDGARDEFVEAFLFSLYWIQKYRRRNGKILIICMTIDNARELMEISKKEFPYLSFGLFVGSGKEKNKELNNDVIFSTTKSMGTGSEIENHQLTINIITYASDVMADQISGRIRKQIDRSGIYCELVNISHQTALKHYKKREPFLAAKAKNGRLIKHEITKSDINEYYENKKYQINGNGQFTSNGLIVIQKRKK